MAKFPTPSNYQTGSEYFCKRFTNLCTYTNNAYWGGSISTSTIVWSVHRYRFSYRYQSETEQVNYLQLLPAPNNNLILIQSEPLRSALVGLANGHQVSPTISDQYGFGDSHSDDPLALTDKYANSQSLYYSYPQNFAYQDFPASQFSLYRTVLSGNTNYFHPPNYINLIDGYHRDNRSRPDKITIKTPENYQSKTIKIGFYRKNVDEKYRKQYAGDIDLSNINTGTPRRNFIDKGLTTIDWVSLSLKLEANKTYRVSTENIVIGTLYFPESDRQDLLITSDGTYPLEFIYYNPQKTAELYQDWINLHHAWILSRESSLIASFGAYITIPSIPVNDDNYYLSSISRRRPILNLYSSFIRRTNQAFYNPWNQNWQPLEDENFRADHPLFDFDDDEYAPLPDERPYNFFACQFNELTGTFKQHFEPQPDESFGRLKMDSPRIIEIHTALDAAKFSTNELDNDSPRIPTLGHHIEMQSKLLGYRVNADGEYEPNQEKEIVRKVVDDNDRVDEQEYGGNGYATKGMLVKRLPNTFDRQGNVVSGGVAMVHDLPQLLAEIHDQLNISLGIQESGAIEIKDGDRIYRYPNQLALLTDLALSCAATHQLAHQAYLSSLVTQQQTGEIISGLGLPTVSRVTNVAIDNKLQQVPYWGIAPQHSIAKKVDTVAYNVGVLLGQVI
jgi:hypothetical protein